MEGTTNIFCQTARTYFSKHREINSETPETSTRRFGIKITLSEKFIHNIYKCPKNLKELFCPSKLLKKSKESSAKVRASSNVRRNVRHAKELTYLGNLHKK